MDATYPDWAKLKQVILKVASRCNLNCSYCYVYNRGDTSWKRRPAIMHDSVFETSLARLRHHCDLYGQRRLTIGFHGGEPCLVGPARFARWCTRLREALPDQQVEIAIQTNGTLLTRKWARVLREHEVSIGISLDGPAEINDESRVDHAGRGSHSRIEHGLQALREEGVGFGFLCVIPLGANPVAVHRHLLSLGGSQVTYILPDITHETKNAIMTQHGPTPCANFLIAVFDEWWSNGTLSFQVGDLWNIARLIMGGDSLFETFGGGAPAYVFVETDGDIEGLDCLRVCGHGISATGLNVQSSDYHEIIDASPLHGQAIFRGMPLPDACRACSECRTCAGGYLPHRYSRQNGFNNRSAWCDDILKLFAHVRDRLDVTTEETHRRRAALQVTRMPTPSTTAFAP